MVTIDGDLQNPPEEIPKLLDAIEKGAFVVTARRAQRYERTWRWLGSRGVHGLARLLTGASIRDFGGQFKAYRREVVEATAQRLGARQADLPARVVARLSGRRGRRRSPAAQRRRLALHARRAGAHQPRPRHQLHDGAAGPAGRRSASRLLAIGLVGLAICAVAAPPGWLWPAICLALFAVGGGLDRGRNARRLPRRASTSRSQARRRS